MHNFTKRAKAWLDDQEPDVDQIGSAYLKMNLRFEKMKSESTVDSSQDETALQDVETCLEMLLEKFVTQGGDVDKLWASTGQQPEEHKAIEYKFDASPLLPSDDQVVSVPLSLLEKQAVIQNLKRILSST